LDVGDSYRRPGHSIALVALQLLQLFADLTAVHQLDRGGQSMGGASTSPAQHPAAASSASSGGIVGIQQRHLRLYTPELRFGCTHRSCASVHTTSASPSSGTVATTTCPAKLVDRSSTLDAFVATCFKWRGGDSDHESHQERQALHPDCFRLESRTFGGPKSGRCPSRSRVGLQ